MKHALCLFGFLLFLGFPSPARSQTSDSLSSTSRPVGGGLNVGDKAPDFESHDLFGKFFSLHKALKDGPLVLVFYRGAWNKDSVDQMGLIQQKIMPLAEKRKFAVAAVSVEVPVEGLKIRQAKNIAFPILIDTKAEILKLYKVQHKVPDDEFKRMREDDNVDLEANSAQKHHLVAIPAVYVIDAKGVIVYAHVKDNDKSRADEGDILKILSKEAKQISPPQKAL